MSENTLPKPWYLKHIWVLAAAVGVLSLTILRCASSRDLTHLAQLYKVAPFELVDQSGAPFSSNELNGKVWIASMVFTSCRTECPMIGKANQELQQALAGLPEVRLVSFSVDPEFDTPALMNTWGQQFGADPARWKLLTGPRKAIESIVIDGFKTHMSDRKVEGGLVQIAHTMKLILVDADGYVRHYFDATVPKDLSLIAAYAKKFTEEAREKTQAQGGKPQ